VHGADRTRCYPTSRSLGHRVPDLCDHLRSSTQGLLLLPRFSSLHVMPHLPPAHHETSKHDSPNETKIKERQNETVPDSNSNIAKSMTHHNQTKELITWFLTDLAASTPRGPAIDVLNFGGGRYRTLPPTPPKGPTIDVFNFGGGRRRTLPPAPLGGPPSTSSTSVVTAAGLKDRRRRPEGG
jgi:hypothetical protein